MATFMPAGGEGDFDEDDFILGNEHDEEDNGTPRILGPVKNVSTKKPLQNGFGRAAPSASKTTDMTKEDFQGASMKGHLDIIEKCLGQGIAIDEVLRGGWTALMYAANCANPDLVKYLLEKGANPHYHKDFYSVLMAACSSNRDKRESILTCVTLLVQAGADVNLRDRYHVSSLMCSAREGHVGVVQFLLNNGAEADKQDNRGWTALSWATYKNHVEVVEALLSQGANPDLRQIDNQKAVDIAKASHNEQIQCLLEGRPYTPSEPVQPRQPFVSFNTSNTQTVNNTQLAHKTNHQELPAPVVRKPPPPEGDMIPADKARDEHHGELEVFLYGLDLGDLVSLFKEQHVDFFNFLRFNEQDLINMGITQIGIRKKILDAIEIVHKKEWDMSSLISVQYNRHIGCPDAIAMVANIAKHLRFIGSSVGYVSDQIHTHHDILEDVREGTGPRQIHKNTQDALKNVHKLEKEIGRLKTRLEKQMKNLSIEPPDLIDVKSRPGNIRQRRLLRVLTVSALVTTVAMVWWKKNEITEKGLSYFFKT